jgi:hypothetical protein
VYILPPFSALKTEAVFFSVTLVVCLQVQTALLPRRPPPTREDSSWVSPKQSFPWRHKWEDNIKIDLRIIICDDLDSILLVWDNIHWGT